MHIHLSLIIIVWFLYHTTAEKVKTPLHLSFFGIDYF